jgi:hypothetical protein
MPAMNPDTRTAWQAIANDLSNQRPSVGKRVKVTGGRKHTGKTGTVSRHQPSRFVNATRYASDAQAHMREMAGRFGYVVMVSPDDGAAFWIDADKVEVI